VTRALGRRKLHHNPSHARLLHNGTKTAAPGASGSGRLNAMIVPASRPASSFTGFIELSARLGTLIVILCSKQTRVDQVAKRVAETPGARALIVEVPAGYELPNGPFRTSATAFKEAGGGRSSDLSLKRNLGLLLARLNGWSKIVFLDDDITLAGVESYRRLAGQLDDKPIAGMICRQFPDNSVVCHARRLAKLYQYNFVSGSVLGVNCGDLPLSFFPDVYNEDWLFFSRAAARGDLANVGDATQSPYEPFANPSRAKHEEFGDLLAEGIYTLMGSVELPSMRYDKLLGIAGSHFWSDFILARQEILTQTAQRLRRFGTADGDDEAGRALRSLEAAEHQLASINPDLCTDFLSAWLDDLRDWETFTDRLCAVGNARAAMDTVGLKDWRWAYTGCQGAN
jgi:hypothetical protein